MLAIREQPSFAGGMFQSVAPERIPDIGAWDIQNGLLEEDGSCNRRGGSSYYSDALGSSALTWIWSGYLGTTKLLLIADETRYGGVSTPPTVYNLGSTGRLSPGYRQAVLNDLLYLPFGVTINAIGTIGAAAKPGPFYATVANRLLAGAGNRVDFSAIGTPTFAATDYHQLPDGVQLTGLEGLRDSAVCFTTRGIFIIGGLAANLTDADGNVQHRIDRYSRDGILWGDAGIAGWEGGLVAPMRDGVWIISLGVASEAVQAYRLISGPIADRYKTYVDAGYGVGAATIYRGHYILPILASAGGVLTNVDTLVCRLDMAGTPWTRMSGASARFHAATVTPEGELLTAGTAGRVQKLSWFDYLRAVEADGSSVSFVLRTRDVAAGRRKSGIVKLRVDYELSTYDLSTPLASDALLTGAATINGRVGDVGGAWVSGPSATDFQIANACFRAAAANAQYAVLGPANVTATTQALISLNPGFGVPNGGVLHRYVDAANHFRVLLSASVGVANATIQAVVGGAVATLVTSSLSGAALTALTTSGAYLRCVSTAYGAWTVSVISTAGLLLQSWTGISAHLATGGALASGKGGIVDLGAAINFAMYWRHFSVAETVVTDAHLYASLVEGPTQEGWQTIGLLGGAPSNLIRGQEASTYTYAVRQSSRYGRFEFACSDPVSRLSLRRFEAFVRENGRQ